MYISSIKPPQYYQNFEFDVFITPPTGDQLLVIEVYPDQANAEKALLTGGVYVKLYGITNELPSSPGDYSDIPGILTFKVLGNSIILKGISPNFSN